MNDAVNESEAAAPTPARCFIVEDNPAIARFIARALSGFGVTSESFLSVPSLRARLKGQLPSLIFLDISLGDSDAIEVLRGLSAAGFAGTVQLMSGSNISLLEDVRQVGQRHGLRMRPVLTKPFRLDAVKRLVEEEDLGSGPAIASPAEPLEPLAKDIKAAPVIDLREALDRNWLELWYQPKFDLFRGTVSGAEGLARVRHPELGLLSPASFIPNASNADLIVLAEYALRAALRDAADLLYAGHPLTLAINVPVEALLSLPIPSIVREGRPRGKDWPGIILEVTEDQIIGDVPAVHEIATQLRIYQIALAIDDFGQGYSSLARLKELPFAELKLDQSFVKDCGRDAANADLCKTVVEIAHRFGATAVAEGIENTSDLAVIRRIGSDVGQGYLFARPMPKEFLVSRLLAGNEGGFAMVHGEGVSAEKSRTSA